MPLLSLNSGKWRFWRSLTINSLSAVVLAAFCFVPFRTAAQEKRGAGVTLAADVDAKDLGLPLYPGSHRHKDKDEDSPAVNLGLWGGGSGFKLAVLKMESDDSPDRVADYYKKALAKYGKVLDCSHASAADADPNERRSPKPITCEDEKPEKGGMLFKAGTKERQHIVGIQPNGHGSFYQLVYLAAWGNDEEK
jgi:hypothetical protein